ncbi:MAG: 30S ribosomal protein S8 [Parcubacteria group bacterium GW2011_GWC2_42_6]|nr:MAG: 30S ribosomal protein S8 [Parcubacteria group bacterium GW2011_GWA2_42_11]KKS68453.1 MAG: 30S ribosomal protein S8 [Parcubacteria group bacterium GW2011_GWC2_42_6]
MDSISDMLIRIKNAQQAGHEFVEMPSSKAKFELGKILKQNGYLESVEKKKVKNKERLVLKLKYEQESPAIRGLKRVSRPGCRIYMKNGQIRPIKQGYGLVIVSTSRGLMVGGEAKKNKLGGEIICEIW